MPNWFITDDDCLQCCNPIPVIEANQFEFMQITRYEGKVDDDTPFFQVSHGTIDLSDYSEDEVKDILHTYGYQDLDDFVIQNSPDQEWVYHEDGTLDRINSPSYLINYQLIAEMFFEQENMEYATAEYSSWNECVEYIAAETGLDLDDFYKGLDDTLILGYRKQNDKHIGFLTTPKELAAATGISPVELMQGIRSGFPRENNIWPVIQTNAGAICARAFPNAKKHPRQAVCNLSLYLRKENDFDSFESISPSANALLPSLMQPVLDFSNGKDLFPSLPSTLWLDENKKYLDELSHVLTATHQLELQRVRQGVTQGHVNVTSNGRFITCYHDDICLKQKDGSLSNGFHEYNDAIQYGQILDGWGSRLPDQTFYKSAITSFCKKITDAMVSSTSLDRQIQAAKGKKPVPAAAGKHDVIKREGRSDRL